MIPIKLIEAVQRRAVLRRLMQDARMMYGPLDSSTPKETIECGEIVPVNHNVVPVTVVHEVVVQLQGLVDAVEEEIMSFSVVERPQGKPAVKGEKDEPSTGEATRDPFAPSKKATVRGGKAS